MSAVDLLPTDPRLGGLRASHLIQPHRAPASARGSWTLVLLVTEFIGITLAGRAVSLPKGLIALVVLRLVSISIGANG